TCCPTSATSILTSNTSKNVKLFTLILSSGFSAKWLSGNVVTEEEPPCWLLIITTRLPPPPLLPPPPPPPDWATTLMAITSVAELPAESVARAVMVWLPSDRPAALNVHDVVPVAAANAPPSMLTSTLSTLVLSEAVPETVNEPAAVMTVAPSDGDVMVIDG